MSEYYIKKKEWLENSAQKGQSLDQIYKNADLRQLKLIQKCVDACILVQEKNNDASTNNMLSIQIDDSSYNVDLSKPEEMKAYREQLCEKNKHRFFENQQWRSEKQRTRGI